MAGGQGLTSGQGSVTPSESKALDGGVITSAQGPLGSTELTGASSSAAAGTAVGSRLLPLRSRKVGGGSSTRALIGSSISNAVGAVIAGPQAQAAGIVISGGLGAFAKSRTVAASGGSVSASHGSVTVLGSSGALSTSFQITSTAGGTDVPFTLGHVFKRGDVPSGQIPTSASVSSWQCDIMTTWPDGSAKFAVLSGKKTLTANVAATINLTSGSAAGGTALTTTDLKNTSITASIGCGAFGTVSWATTDWDSPFQTLITGPVMSSWTYRKPVGSDAHLVGWLEVRLYAGGAVEVLPWVENGYLTVASPINKSDTYSFTLGGTQRFSGVIDLKHHSRAVLVSGSSFTHWLASDPGVVPKHNGAYMMASKMVPNYGGGTSPSAATLNGLTQSYSPMLSPISNMGSAGSHPALLEHGPVWYLTTGDARAWRNTMTFGFGSGTYSMHYRDQATNQPFVLTSYGNLWISESGVDQGGTPTIPTPAGGNGGGGYTKTHAPCWAYPAYLVSGFNWFLDELVFQNNYNSITSDYIRRFTTEGIMHSKNGAYTERGAGWSLRTLFEAAAVVPSTHACYTSIINQVERNAIRFKEWYIDGVLYSDQYSSNLDLRNELGLFTLYTDYNDSGSEGGTGIWFAPWQQAFITAAIGFGWDIATNISTTARNAFQAVRDWNYKWIVGIFGGGSEGSVLSYRWANTYTFPLSSNKTTWFTSWSECGGEYLAQNPTAVTGSAQGLSITDGTSDATAIDFYDAWVGQRIPAIAYAAEHGAGGAQEAWQWLTRSSSWSLAEGAWNTEARLGVYPRTTAPSWAPTTGQVVAASTNTINSVRGTEPASNIFAAWSGIAFAPWWGAYGSLSAQGGGHGDGDSNAEYRFDVSTRLWSKEKTGATVFYQSIYGGTYCADQTTGWMWSASSGTGTQTGQPFTSHFYTYRIALPPSAIPQQGAANGWIYTPGRRSMPDTGQVSTSQAHKRRLGLDQTWTLHGSGATTNADHGAAAYDNKRRRVWYTQDGPTSIAYYRDMATGNQGSLSLSASLVDGTFYAIMEYDSDSDCLVIVDGQDGSLYLKVIDCATGTVYSPTTTGTAPTLSSANAWAWSKAWRSLVWHDGGGGSTIYFLKPPANPRNNGWTWTSQSLGSALSARDSTNPAYNRLRHMPALGNVLLWVPGYNTAVQAVGVTPP